MNSIIQIDYALFAAINGLAGRWPWLDTLALLLLNDYFVPTLLAISLLALWFEGASQSEQQNNQRAVLVAALGAALANILLKITNLLYFRPRPFAQYQVNLLFYRPTDSSLPSNAAVLGFVIAAGVWYYNRSWGWSLISIALIFGLSRIYGGVHFPLDVMAGAGLGLTSAWLVHRQKRPVEALLRLVLAWANKLGLS